MADDNRGMIEYLLLLKKTTASVRQRHFPGYTEIEEDVSQEAFIKLYESDFFSKDDHTGKNSYIYRTVKNCFLDKLKSLGVFRKLTKAEAKNTGNKTVNISTVTIDDWVETSEPESELLSPEGNFDAEEAYQWIKNCFDSVYDSINDSKRKSFFDSAFWWYNDQGMPVKELATFIGYESSNPTQELNRLIQKVSMCTEPHGISVTCPHEQVQFLQEQIEISVVQS
jgi:DNA-directed RNA polymerase specialized sigma24 family protein